MEDKKFKKKLDILIKDSTLNNDEKMLWVLFLKISKSEEDEAIFEAASEGDENIVLLTKFLRDKIMHMKESDKKAWNKLTKDEERYAMIIE